MQRLTTLVLCGLALAISKVTTPIFMGIVYFLVILPIGLVRRNVGDRLMAPAASSGTVWVEKEATRSDLTRQF